MILSAAVCQEQAYDPKVYLEWNEYNPLEWTDFKTTNSEAFGDAGTHVRIMARPYLVKRKVYYNVYALFDKKRSWSNEQGDKLLAHEQLHFDIAELYARKIRKSIELLARKGEKELKIYNDVVNSLMTESNEFDQQYDLETLHGTLYNRQLEWEAKIKTALAGLNHYKSGHYKPEY